MAATAGEENDAGRRQHHPQEVQTSTRPGDGERERPDELDRDRDAERDASERVVERHVHRGEHESEQHSEPEVVAATPTEPRP